MDEKVALVMVTLGHLAVESDPRVRLERIVELCSRATDADRCSVYAVDRERGWVHALAAEALDVELRLPLGRGLAGHVAQTGETVNSPDVYGDPRFDPEVDRLSGYRTTNILAVPVWSPDGGTVVGVIQVLNKRGGAFERHDQMLLERIAEWMGPLFDQLVMREGGKR